MAILLPIAICFAPLKALINVARSSGSIRRGTAAWELSPPLVSCGGKSLIFFWRRVVVDRCRAAAVSLRYACTLRILDMLLALRQRTDEFEEVVSSFSQFRIGIGLDVLEFLAQNLL